MHKSTILEPMKKQEIGRLLFRELEKVYYHKDWTTKEKVEGLSRLMSKAFVEVTKEERVLFTTLFSRISYACQRYEVKKQAAFFIHNFRIESKRLWKGKQITEEDLENQLYPLGLQAVAESIAALFVVDIPDTIQKILPPKGFYKSRPVEIQSFIPSVRVVVLGENEEKHELIAQVEDGTGEEIIIQYNIPERNENFNPTIRAIRKTFGFPITLNLLDVEIDKAGIYRPLAFVIQPDYLIDVTAVAECFKDHGTEPFLYLLKKFTAFTTGAPLMIGHIANYFLDELMTNSERSFKELFPTVFKLNPIGFTMFSDQEIRDIHGRSQFHYKTLKNMVLRDFAAQAVKVEDCYIEPSFYSSQYGLQGRLDVFYNNLEEEEKATIIELKSGKVYRPNQYGINHSHYTQTLLYDLLIRSTYGKTIQPTNYILYSGAEQRPLRFAPTIKAQQYEAIQLRNQLLAIEQALVNMRDGDLVNPTILRHLHPDKFPHLTGFTKRDMAAFATTFEALNPIERKYFSLFTSFIAREHQIAKTGIHGSHKRNGQAAIWLDSYQQKEEDFDIISCLEIKETTLKEEDPKITFAKTVATNDLANFRRGDIGFLYPYRKLEDTPLKDQVFKCTIIRITNKEVVVRLRSKQFNTAIFEEEILWNLEHDLMDSGFTKLYQGLIDFAKATPQQRGMLLAQNPPRMPLQQNITAPKELTEEQQKIYQQIINARDYFLLWGPPGTGKTSMMLKHIVAYLWKNTDENILLLAYTNRAVDEICEAIENIDDNIKEDYLRIGSRYSTGAQFQDQLLDHKMKGITTRKDLKALLENHRIYVSTVNSMAGKKDLFQLKKFHQVIIDEASQLLEPYLVGLLPHFERFILIGDHQQLPAVVLQDEQLSEVQDEELKTIGLQNLRDSYFERLYKQGIKNGWHWAHAQLSHQGRMHQAIMDIPNRFFYESNLKILPDTTAVHQGQIEELTYQLPKDPTFLEHELCAKRVLYIDTPIDDGSKTRKTNRHEAWKILELIQSIHRIYAANEIPITGKSIGVITPYRAQIAQIRQHLLDEKLDFGHVTIDTVERYQGGARDIIILSLCTNSLSQLDSLVSLSHEGVDRRLNVALTRARKHLIILGNEEILKANAVYGALIGDLMKAEPSE